MFKNGRIRSRLPRQQEAHHWKIWTLDTFITGRHMKKQLYMFLQSPEFDVVSVNWWSAKFPKQEPTNEGKAKKDLFLEAILPYFAEFCE